MDSFQLLQRCADQMREGRNDGRTLAAAEHDALDHWNRAISRRAKPLAKVILKANTETWEGLITGHRAHQHAWYDYIAESISIDEIAKFLLENGHYPVFLELLKAIEEIQVLDDARQAVQENIADERQPESHAELMRRLMLAVKKRAHPNLALETYPSLIDRTLVFYYGFYRDPWHLVGSVFATERMGTRRVVCMDRGLRRLGLDDHELAFTIVHSVCDDHHASDWLDRVIVPTTTINNDARKAITEGIAACLLSSEEYLDFQLDRVGQGTRRAAAANLF